ncbi:hypothetical protein KDI_46450 [Dictyobacter arantiisoli]|uniref:Uncharacterized protein n=1 Tax=Dictyobacter arantiisoli TaxID=2014874 RepID=A0A5A5THM2_9CHLR|nr:hypothetical protein KDI_46450 [Dictyobacter arantiisoli]
MGRIAGWQIELTYDDVASFHTNDYTRTQYLSFVIIIEGVVSNAD